jgi:hypothetical protein
MKIKTASALSLAALIQHDLAAVNKLEAYVRQFPGSGCSRAEVDSLGFSLQSLYNALENSFSQISLSFENQVRDEQHWHRELLEKMFLDLSPLRPAVLDPKMRALLSDFLGFRNVLQHEYELTLDEARTVALWQRWQREGSVVKTALADFAAQLVRLADAKR